VKEGQTGLLVPPADGSSLARACLEVMDAPVERRLAWGQAGRELVDAEFSLEVVVERWLQLYANLSRHKQPTLQMSNLS
jgi:glycosyltransferase involved in cell wall biosynthesis